jgi:hypothetical protein
MKMEPAKSFTADPAQLLRNLRYALRDPELRPPGFKFNFLFADDCALGLAHELGMIEDCTPDAAMAAFGLSSRDANKIFVAGWCEIQVSAAMVADRIDAYLARRGSEQ